MKIQVQKINFFLGMQNDGKMLSNAHVAADDKKLYVIPGQYAIIDTTTPAGRNVIREVPIGPFGWEYTI